MEDCQFIFNGSIKFFIDYLSIFNYLFELCLHT